MKDIRLTAPLTPRQQRKCILAWQRRRSQRGLLMLLRHHQGAITSRARYWLRKGRGRASFDDLYQEGVIAFVKVVERFDVDRGTVQWAFVWALLDRGAI